MKDSSRRVLFNEDQDNLVSPRSHNSKLEAAADGEPVTPTAQSRTPLLNDELGSSNKKYLDSDTSWSAQDKSLSVNDVINDSVGEEIDNNPTDQTSIEDDPFDGEAPTLGSDGLSNLVESSERGDINEDGAESNPILEAEKKDFILCNTTKKRGYLPQNVIANGDDAREESDNITMIFVKDRDDLLSPNQEAATDGKPKTQNQMPPPNDANTSLSAPSKSAAATYVIINSDGGEEIDNNPTDQPSIEDVPFDGEAPSGPSNLAESSERGDANEDGVESNPIPEAGKKDFILCNTTKKRGYLPQKVIADGDDVGEESDNIPMIFVQDRDDLLSPNQGAAADGKPKTQNQMPPPNDANTSLSAPNKSATATDVIIDSDRGEEINNNPTDQPSIEDVPFDGEAPTLGLGGPSNLAESSERGDANEDGVESNPIPEAGKKDFILCNTTKKRNRSLLSVIFDSDVEEESDNVTMVSIKDQDDPFSPNQEVPFKEDQGQGDVICKAESSKREDINEDGNTSIPIPKLKNKCYSFYNTTKLQEGYFPSNNLLHQAVVKDDWNTAKIIFDQNPSAISTKITSADETALHIAAAAKHVGFVEKLLPLMTREDISLQTDEGHTAIHYAAGSGVVRIAALMVEKDPNLPNIHDAHKPTPVLMAVLFKRKDMASFLFSNTHFDALEISAQIELLIATISTDYYDLALDILRKKPELAIRKINEQDETALHVLAKKPTDIRSSSGLSFWNTYINSWFSNKALNQTLARETVQALWRIVLGELSNPNDLVKFIETPTNLLHDAARVGNVELLIILCKSCPYLLWRLDANYKTIFHIAVENRQESVFSLIYDIGGLQDYMAYYYDQNKNLNMLHLAGKLAPPHHLNRVSGAALQMQRELLWFKEVEKIVISTHLQMRCKNNETELSTIEIRNNKEDELTPRELFTKEHKQLLEDGEKWMKNTANSCMLVATLIATVVFAAAFTIPGGNDNNTGTPIFRQKDPFIVFVISDVAALISSTTSIFIFLSILTSRYTEDDFLVSLPTKLLSGLAMLFVSVVCMVVAFSATFFIVYDGAKGKNVAFAIAMVTIIPVSCFYRLHFKLMMDILHSVYGSKFSFRQRKKRLF